MNQTEGGGDDQRDVKPKAGPPDDVAALIELAKETPLLTAEEEKELWRRIVQVNSQDPQEKADAETACNHMVDAHLRLMITMALKAHRSHNHSLPPAELIRAGHVALKWAARKFDPILSNHFSTFASTCIRNALLRRLAG